MRSGQELKHCAREGGYCSAASSDEAEERWAVSGAFDGLDRAGSECFGVGVETRGVRIILANSGARLSVGTVRPEGSACDPPHLLGISYRRRSPRVCVQPGRSR